MNIARASIVTQAPGTVDGETPNAPCWVVVESSSQHEVPSCMRVMVVVTPLLVEVLYWEFELAPVEVDVLGQASEQF